MHAALDMPIRGFLEDLPLASIAVDRGSRIAYANAAAAALFGGAAGELVGASFFDFLPVGERSGFVVRAADWRGGNAAVFRGVVQGPGKSLAGVIGIPIVLRDERHDFAGAMILFLGVPALRDLLANYLERVRDNVSATLAQIVAEAREAHAAAASYSPLARTRKDSRKLQSLSDREWEVVERVARGQRVAQVASDLGVAISTARNHLKASFKKLGVKSQAELVALVLGGSGGPR